MASAPSISLLSEPNALTDEEDLTTEWIENGKDHSISSSGGGGKSALFGRSSETTLLLRSFQGVCGPASKSKVVSVHGVSGVGKTSLVRASLRDVVSLRGKGYFVEGKFDQVVSNAPFTGVIEALSDLCDVIEQSADFEEVHKPRIEKVLEASSPNIISVLARLFPRPRLFGTELEEVIAGEYKSNSPKKSKGDVSEAFRVLVRALASPTRPCVIFLDDVQWANHGSIDVIEALTTDPDSTNVLYVLAGRDKDPNEEIYQDLMERISASTRVVDVRPELLDKGSVHQIVCWVLSMAPSDKTRDLADVVTDKTFANPLQVMQYIGSLRLQGLLELDSRLRWTFDVEKIRNETDVSDSVAAQVGSRLSLLDQQTSTVLRFAAFLGFNFHLGALASVVDYSMTRRVPKRQGQEFDWSLDTSAVASAVNTCCDQNLVEPMLGKDGWFKFSHDSIQQSLYDSLPDDVDNAMMHFLIGSCLNQLEDKLPVFEVADHLNRAIGLVGNNDNELLNLAKMNVEAASISLESLDLSSSSHYANLALECLMVGQIGWSSSEEHHRLNLDVNMLLARTSLQLGDYQRCHHFCSEIRANGRDLSETGHANITTCCAFRGQNKPTEAVDFALEVLSDLNVHVPRAPTSLQVLGKLTRVRRLLRKRFGSDGSSRYDILEWPETTDDTTSYVVTMLSYCGLIAHVAGEQNFSVYAFLYLVQQALQKKVFFADSSAFAFALYGYVELLFGKDEVAHKYGELVSQMLKRSKMYVNKSRSLFVMNCCLLRSKQLVRECVEPCFQAYEMALAGTDVDGASLMLRAHMHCAMYSDVNLLQLNNSVRRHCQRFKQDYKSENFFQWISVLWQALQCMIGETDSPTMLTGDVTTEEEALTMARLSSNEMLLAALYGVKLDLVVLFGTITRSETIAYEYCKCATALDNIHFGARMAYFSAALAHVDFMRVGVGLGKARLASFFRKSLKLFKGWKSRGLVNETPYCLVLEAEAASLSLLKSRLSRRSTGTSVSRVLELYDKGIAAAKAAGCSRLEAQATERAGRMLIKADKHAEAKEYIDKASDLFLTWGALAKIDQMRSKYAFLEKSTRPPPSSLHEIQIK